MTTNLIPVEFNDKQREFMEAKDPELLFSGAFGAGKSRVGCEKGYFLSCKYPGNFGLILRKNFVDLRHSTMETWFRQVTPDGQYTYNKNTAECRLPNSSRILFSGLDESSSIGSMEFGWIFVDEARELNEDDWIMLIGRLRLGGIPFRQLMGATNPDSTSHFLYKRFFLEKAGRPITASAMDNAKFLPASYLEQLQRFKGIYYQRYVLGLWVGFEGLVYPRFDPAIHVIKPLWRRPPDTGWDIYRAIDFGYTNPFVCQWWCREQDDGSGKRRPWYLWKEIYRSHRTVEEHAAQIRDITGNLRIRATFADWDAEDRATLERHGIPTVMARKEISSGIMEVTTHLDNGGIFLFEDALVERDPELNKGSLPSSTADEFASYKWPEGSGVKNGKETPVDKDNHGMDSMRYLVYSTRTSMGSNMVHSGAKVDVPYPEPARRPQRTWRRELVVSPSKFSRMR